jgi:hypothetical protein
MRTSYRVLLCAALAGSVGACSGLGMVEPPARIVSQPPSEPALEQSLVMVATTVKWAGTVEASPVRHAHLLAPGDWIVCAQSSVRDLSPPYAMFFTGDKLVHYRIAVEVDDCQRAPYAPAAALAGPPGQQVEPHVAQPPGPQARQRAGRQFGQQGGPLVRP